MNLQTVIDWLSGRRLSGSQRQILAVLAAGGTLKSHRSLDGQKRYCLRSVQGDEYGVTSLAVSRLLDRGLLYSNQKFPTATLQLTESGWLLAPENGKTTKAG